MFWAIVGALLFVFIGIPILLNLIITKEFWYFIFGTIVVIGIIIAIILLKNGESGKSYEKQGSINSSQSLTSNSLNNPTYQVQNTLKVPVNNIKERCVEESYIKICDLIYSSLGDSTGYRNTFLKGTNNAACVEMKTGNVIENSLTNIRASDNKSFCASDHGYVYIDPGLKVAKFYGKITRENNDGPYKISSNYDTCLWTFQGGNHAVPYLEVLSNIGPRGDNIYGAAAFCKNGDSQVDIYTESN